MLLIRKLRFRIALWCWARVLPALVWRRDLTSLMALTKPAPRVPYRGLAAEYIVRRVKKTTRRPWLMRDRPCLRDGILAMRFLRLAGYEPTLHFGLDKNSVGADTLSAHCWVALNNKIMLNPPTPSMIEILIYARDQLLPPAREASPAAQG